MKRLACWCVIVVAMVIQGRSASAQVIGGVVSQEEAQRHGLTRAWYVQADVSRMVGKIVDTTLSDGMLLIQTSRARLQAIDAETGGTLWSATVGNDLYPSLVPAAGPNHVATINSSTLYVVNRKTGREVWNRELPSAVGSGPAVSKTHVFVPMVNGMMMGFEIADPKKAPFVYKSFGRILVQPVVTADSLAWTTEQGFLYFLSLAVPERMQVNFRLDTKDKIESRPGYWTPYLYSVSLDGYVYAVHEQSGLIHWKFPTAEPIVDAPVAVNGKVYVCREEGGMFCLDGETGAEVWFAPNVTEFVSASPTRVYATDRLERMVILDGKTGSRLDSMSIRGVVQKVRNVQSDRIYLTTGNGFIQCLHETELTQPVTYTPPPLPTKHPVKAKKKEGDAEPAAEAETKATETPAEDPATEESNPFDSNADSKEEPGEMKEEAPKEEEDNPFGEP